MIYGYCRCSTNESRQNIKRQERELLLMGVADKKNIYKEYESGMKVKRIELNRLLEAVNKGDTIVATEVSRITRSTKQLCEIIDIAREKELKLMLGSFTVDFSKGLNPMTEGMLKMMGVFSELERNIISERVKSGIANAKSNGKRIGRPSLTVDDIPLKVKNTYKIYRDGIISKTDYAKICGISRPTLYKYLELMSG